MTRSHAVAALACLALCVSFARPADAGPVDPISATQVPGDGIGFATGLKGLSFSLPSGGGPTVGVTYFLTPTTAVRADLGLGLQFTGNSDYAFSVEVSYRVYLGKVGGRLFPFVAPGVFFNRINSAENLAAEAGVGAEYFLLERFSITGLTGLALQLNGIGGSGSTILKLATGTSALAANFYF